MALDAGQQFVEAAFRGQRLQHQFKRAAAGQPKTVRFIGGDTVSNTLGWSVGHRLARYRVGMIGICGAKARNEIVFNAAAGDRADDAAGLAQGHDRADRSG